MNMKKISAFLMACVFMIFVSGCNNSAVTDTATESEQTPESTVSEELSDGAKSMETFTITYYDFQAANALTDRQLEAAKTEYNIVYPNATIEYSSAPTDGLALLQTQLASGTGADVFKHQTRLADFAQAGYLYPLSDLGWEDKILDACKPDSIYDGTVYAVPADANGWGFYYNKAIFEDELGLAAPTTFDEFMDICGTIKDAGYDPIVTGGAEGWPYQGLFLSFTSFLYGANENYHTALYNSEVSLDGPEMMDLFSAIEELYDAGYISEASNSIDMTVARQMIGENKAVMSPGAPGVITPLEEDGSGYDIDLGFFYLPDRGGYNCLPVIANTVFSVNSQYEHASTYGVDLVNAFVSDSALHAAFDNVTPAAIKGVSMTYNTTGGQSYQDAFDKGPVVLQATSWLPSSMFSLYQQVVSSIVSGNGYSEQMLMDMQATYEADKDSVNIITP